MRDSKNHTTLFMTKMSHGSEVSARQILCRVASHQEVSSGYWRLRFENAFVAENARAGQFVHLLPRASGINDPLLRRAFSILRTENNCFEILYRAGGKGTQLMTQFRVDDEVDVIAPLGKPFDAKDKDVVLVGGGVGVPPLAMLARQRFLAGFASTTSVIIGARAQADVLCLDDFAQCGVLPQIVTEDGSLGRKGFVTIMLQEVLERKIEDRIVQACGPWPMLRAVALLCAQHSVPCQVSMEENMPCGVGVCNGCVVKMSESDDEYSMYRRICVDGPVVWAHEIDWNR